MKTIIIGGVAAGMSAASKLKRLDPTHEVVVLERGGETSYGACGLPYYVSGVNQQENLLRIRKAEAFIKSGIDLRLHHEALSVDTEGKRVEIRSLESGKTTWEEYDHLVIATGADAIVPGWPGRDLAGVHTLKTIGDANRLREAASSARKVAVIGGGYIGLEMVEAFHHMGKKVVLIEMAPRVLTGFDPEFSRQIEAYLETLGVELHLGEAVTALAGDSAVSGVVTDQGSYPADLVLVAVGVRPNTGFLQNTGLAMLPNGAVKIDRQMATSLPHIWAAGDCATVWHKLLEKDVFMPLATNANKQGRYVAENLMGQPHPYETATGTAMIKVGELELGRTGLSETEANQHGIPVVGVQVENADHAPYYPNSRPLTVKMVFHAESSVILGAQLLGYQGAALRTDVMAACIAAAMTAKQIGELDLGYAPPYAMPWDALHVAANVAESKLAKMRKGG